MRGADVAERVTQRVEVRLAEERGYQRDGEQDDQPRRIDDQAGGEAQYRDDVLYLSEQLPHQRHAPARLHARAIHAVLEGGVFKVGEIEGGGVLHQPYARVVADTVGKQPVDQRDGPAEEIGGDRQSELDQEQHLEPAEQTGAQPTREAIGANSEVT